MTTPENSDTINRSQAKAAQHRDAVRIVLSKLEEEREWDSPAKRLIGFVEDYDERLAKAEDDAEEVALSAPITAVSDLTMKFAIIARYAQIGLEVAFHVERLEAQINDFKKGARLAIV